MNKKLYYVVEKELEDIDGIGTTNGFKSISLYSIEDNVPISMGVIDGVHNDTKTNDAIEDYLCDNGYGDETFELIQL